MHTDNTAHTHTCTHIHTHAHTHMDLRSCTSDKHLSSNSLFRGLRYLLARAEMSTEYRRWQQTERQYGDWCQYLKLVGCVWNGTHMLASSSRSTQWTANRVKSPSHGSTIPPWSLIMAAVMWPQTPFAFLFSFGGWSLAHPTQFQTGDERQREIHLGCCAAQTRPKHLPRPSLPLCSQTLRKSWSAWTFNEQCTMLEKIFSNSAETIYIDSQKIQSYRLISVRCQATQKIEIFCEFQQTYFETEQCRSKGFEKHNIQVQEESRENFWRSQVSRYSTRKICPAGHRSLNGWKATKLMTCWCFRQSNTELFP